MKKLIVFISILSILSSCFKEENKLEQILNSSSSINIEEDYSSQKYFSLINKTIVSENKWNIWNLAFYAQEDDFFIRLNHAANMQAYKTDLTFDEIQTIDNNWNFKVDSADGSRENVVLAYNINHTSNDTVYYDSTTYVLSLGKTALGEDLGYKKFQLLYTYQDKYFFIFADISSSFANFGQIKKDNTLNFVYYSFEDNGKTVQVEPDKATWDLLFTRSPDITQRDTIILYDYTVASVLLNPLTTTAYAETTIKYKDQTYSNIKPELFSSKYNEIGYDWKDYNIDQSIYSIVENRHYVIRDVNNNFFKLKFISFYNPETNLKGTFSFEYELL